MAAAGFTKLRYVVGGGHPGAHRRVSVCTRTGARQTPRPTRGRLGLRLRAHELVTETRAFERDDVSSTFAAVLTADPQWSALSPLDCDQFGLVVSRAGFRLPGRESGIIGTFAGGHDRSEEFVTAQVFVPAVDALAARAPAMYAASAASSDDESAGPRWKSASSKWREVLMAGECARCRVNRSACSQQRRHWHSC
jgi:hypothetical protein